MSSEPCNVVFTTMHMQGAFVLGAVVIFAANVSKMALFYEKVLGATATEEGNDVRLRTKTDELLIHSMPKAVAKKIKIDVPPRRRSETPIKPAFDVTSLPEALKEVVPAGGVDTKYSFNHNGTDRHDILDPEGNVVQLRSPEK
jgi:predicted enzyme related to lactoylglutathione lyase